MVNEFHIVLENGILKELRLMVFERKESEVVNFVSPQRINENCELKCQG